MKTRRRQNSNNRRTQKHRGGLGFRNRTNLQFTFNNTELKCQLCNNNVFNEIKSSINRSKMMTFMAGNMTEDLISHPMVMLQCISCNHCLMIYGRDLPANFKTASFSQEQMPAEQNTDTSNSPPPPIKRSSSFWF